MKISLGLGEGHHFAPAIRTINNWFPVTERGRATSFFATSWTVAPAIVPILLTNIAALWFFGEWQPVFYFLAVPGLLGILALWYFVSDSPEEMLKKGRLRQEEYKTIIDGSLSEDSTTKKGTLVFLKDGYFYIYTVALFCQLAIYWGMTTWLSTFLVQQHGMDIKQMGFFASAPYIVALFAMMLGGWLMDKVFHRMKPVALIAYLGCIPIPWILGTVEKGQTGLLLVLLLLAGFFVNLNFGPIYAYVQKRFPKEVVGSATGLANGIGQFGAFVSPLIAGYLIKSGPGGHSDFSMVFVFFSLISAGAAFCSLLLKEQQIGAETTAETAPSKSADA